MQFIASGHLHGRVAFLPLGPITLKSFKPLPYKVTPKTLGEHLRKRRFEAGLLQKELALRLRVNAWTLLGWEHDRHIPPPRFWARLIAFLGYDPFPSGERLDSDLNPG